MIDHSEAAAEFLSDIRRSRWHDQALWFVRSKRDRAAKSVPEWEDLRKAAETVKKHTLEHLAYYLELFERRATGRGIEIFWARDAGELNGIVLDLLKEHGAKHIVKSKSMLTEECGLNDFLHVHGMEVTDTDLGERIVQLAGDRPSHIVLPAIHLKKEDVSDIFAEHLGAEEGNSDPGYLTRVARKHLREKFLGADAAITGVNFALAEEGGFVVCTNEGNADLGAALPDLHIACMGLEKVIPSARHLGIFTRLLARSATGQAITAYTSHFLGPKPGGRQCVIILDNGRSRQSKSIYGQALSCIRCGACMNTCPVYRRSGGHSYDGVIPGPIGTVLAGAREPGNQPSVSFACTLCASCDGVCPVRIPLHDHICHTRKKIMEMYLFAKKKKGLKMAAWILDHPAIYRFLMEAVRYMFPRLPRRILYGRFNAWGLQREMPMPADKSFCQWYRERKRK